MFSQSQVNGRRRQGLIFCVVPVSERCGFPTVARVLNSFPTRSHHVYSLVN